MPPSSAPRHVSTWCIPFLDDSSSMQKHSLYDYWQSRWYCAWFCFAAVVELVRNLVAHGDARERMWRGNWRMAWVTSTLTPPPKVVYPALLKLMRTPRLPAVDWTDTPNDLNGLVRFGEWRNLVSACMPSRSARAITLMIFVTLAK